MNCMFKVAIAGLCGEAEMRLAIMVMVAACALTGCQLTQSVSTARRRYG